MKMNYVYKGYKSLNSFTPHPHVLMISSDAFKTHQRDKPNGTKLHGETS